MSNDLKTYKYISPEVYMHGVLKPGDIVKGKEVPGHFSNWPYLIVYNNDGSELTTAYLARFEEV